MQTIFDFVDNFKDKFKKTKNELDQLKIKYEILLKLNEDHV